MNQTFRDQLTCAFPNEVTFEEPLKEYTSFGIGGLADVLVRVKTLASLKELISLAHYCQQPFFILGGGTNLLVRDKGIRGLVIRLDGEFNQAMVEGEEAEEGLGDKIIAWAACPISSLLRLSIQSSLSGLEFAAGLPGLLGGAVYMNAGTVEEGIGDLVKEVLLIGRDGSTKIRPAAELGFSYRHSSILPGEVILQATLQLQRCEDNRAILSMISERYAYRASHQPLRERSAGCIFKNPAGDSAGKLIDQAGLKGASVGDAQVSPVHANFIVNRNKAKGADVLRLIDLIQRRVYQSFGIILETEIMIVGEE